MRKMALLLSALALVSCDTQPNINVPVTSVPAAFRNQDFQESTDPEIFTVAPAVLQDQWWAIFNDDKVYRTFWNCYFNTFAFNFIKKEKSFSIK